MWNWFQELFSWAKTKPTKIRENEFDFIVIDFETANANKSSICSCGLAAVKDGVVVKEQHFLIRPKELKFHPMNIRIHGIKEKDVKDKPEFDAYWPEISKLVTGGLVVAHNASFDIAALKSVLDLYNIPHPNIDYICSVKLCKKMLPELKNHKLNTVAEHFAIELKHHDALSDAIACANIVTKICNLNKTNSLHLLIDQLQFHKDVKSLHV